MIIISRHVEQLSTRINEEILRETSFKSRIYDITFENDLDSLDCLILPGNLNIYNSLKKFTHVVNYENQPIQVIINLC